MNDMHYVDTEQKLKEMCDRLCSESFIAVDTEFIREKSYFSKLALIQIALTKGVYFVDPLAVDDLSPLFEVFEHPEIVKVFHAAEQDLDTLFHRRQSIPSPIFDTQVAASLLGLGEQMGYAALVKRLLSIELSKGASRTDWMKRPLSPEQLRYAADDVRYLLQLYPILNDKLKALGRQGWIENELVDLTDPARYEVDPDTTWMKVKGMGKLKPNQLNVLRHLASWREMTAMRKDIPKRWVLSDEALVEMAITQPDSSKGINNSRLLKGRISQKSVGEILSVIARASREPKSHWPESLNRKRPSPKEEATMDMLMAVCRLQAEQHQLSPGQITSRGELLRIVRNERELPLFKGWRLKIAGERVMDVLNGDYILFCTAGKATLTLKSR